MTAIKTTRLPVVAGVDGSAAALTAVRWAAREAAMRHVPLKLVHALGVDELLAGMTLPPGEGVREKLRAQGWELLTEAKRAARAVRPIDVTLELATGAPGPALVAAAREACLLAVASSGKGRFLSGLAIGSTAVQAAAHAVAPVVVVRGDASDRNGWSGPVVVGIDGSPLSESALGYAFEEASARGASLTAVHAWNDYDMRMLVSEVRVYFDYEPIKDTQTRLLAERLAGWQEKYPEVEVERVVVEDRPRHILLELSADAQLLVVGSRGRGGMSGLLLGSVSQALVHHAACPVMVVKPERED